MTAQLPLPLPHVTSAAAADFVADGSNRAALTWLARPTEWPTGRLLLAGPSGCGKTHLLRATAAARDWPLLGAAALHGLPPLPEATGLALDAADAAPAEPLLHLLNLCAEHGIHVLLAARSAPTGWVVPLRDLASRLRATTVATIGPPSDALLAALLAKHLADRQLRVEPAVQDWLLRRLPREAAAVAAAAARLDRAALAAGRRVSLPLARSLFAELVDCDGSVADRPAASHAADPLL